MLAALFFRDCSDAPPILVRYLLAICPVLVQSITEHLLDMYWTSTEHEWELLTCCILATLGIGYILVLLEPLDLTFVEFCHDSA